MNRATRVIDFLQELHGVEAVSGPASASAHDAALDLASGILYSPDPRKPDGGFFLAKLPSGASVAITEQKLTAYLLQRHAWAEATSEGTAADLGYQDLLEQMARQVG